MKFQDDISMPIHTYIRTAETNVPLFQSWGHKNDDDPFFFKYLTGNKLR